MKLAEYFNAAALIRRPVVEAVLTILDPFRHAPMGNRNAQIGSVTRALWPAIENGHRESARLARRFYDEERLAKTGTDDRHDLFLDVFPFEYYAEAMVPAVVDLARDLERAYSPINGEELPRVNAHRADGAIAEIAGVATQLTDRGARRTTLRAVETDPQVAGWARVEGGAESCAFCLMLISRGPVYTSADAAGLDADDVSAVEIARQYQETGDRSELDSLQRRFHSFCDCQVVPVFDRSDWSGRSQYVEAEKRWIEASKAATEAGVSPLTALRHQLAGTDIPQNKDDR